MAISEDDPITLKEAVELVFRGTISVSTLRVEAERGNLEIFKVGRRYFTTLRNVRDMTKKTSVASKPTLRPGPGDNEQRKTAAVRSCELTIANLRKIPKPNAIGQTAPGLTVEQASQRIKDRQRDLRELEKTKKR